MIEKNTVHFIDNNWSLLNQEIENKNYSQIYLLADSNTSEFCLPIIRGEIEQEFQLIEVEPGEESKDLAICQHIWQEFSEEHTDRKALLINLGGGVICDLGGFIASIYKRGIDFINIPTSLLAMVDASVGGKCGIDFLGFKNQLGVFNPAKKCFINPNFLSTLPSQERLSGFAEMLKHGLIADKTHWQKLQKIEISSISPNEKMLQSTILIKQAIVLSDPLELGDRKKLNFGHTVGHAIESHFLQQSKPIPHGFAVAAGILVESYISSKLTGLEIPELLQINDCIQSIYKKIDITENDFDSILAFIGQDKKSENKESRFSLLKKIGVCEINQQVNADLIREGLQFYIQVYED